jgi:hypothetical protein
MTEADSVLSTPRIDSSSNTNVVQFAAFAAAAKLAKEESPEGGTLTQYRSERLARRAKRIAVLETAPETLTVTCRNKRLREQRQIPWRKAQVTTEYWRARMRWCDALTSAQTVGIKEAVGDKGDHRDDRNFSLQKWRESIAEQLLTPAPDVGAVTWKRSQLRDQQWRYSVTDKQVERAIADDVVWLEQHPTKKSLLAAAQAKYRKSRKPETPTS